MKKSFLSVMIIIMMLSVIGCGKKEENVDSKNQTKVNGQEKEKDYSIPKENQDERYKLLEEGDWVQFDKGYSLGFAKSGEFYYHWDGSPVGNSDLYDVYTYDGKGSICITISYRDKISKEDNMGLPDIKAQILYIDDKTLVLEFDEKSDSLALEIEKGDVVEFYNDEKCWSDNGDYLGAYTGYEYLGECEKCVVNGEDSYVTVLNIDDKELKVAPSSYDKDMAKEFDDNIRTLKMAKNAKFYSLSTKDVIVEDESAKHTCEYKELTLEEATYNPDNSTKSAFIYYSHDYEVEKVVIYGGMIIHEGNEE